MGKPYLCLRWPDKEPAKAESGLKPSPFQARWALNRDWIVYEDGKYRLAPHGQYHFDLPVEELLKIAERLPQDSNLRIWCTEEAVDLYDGDSLQEF